MKKTTALYALILCLASFLAAWAGLGLTAGNVLTPTNSLGRFEKIQGDGWIENGSVINLPDLAPRGNRLLLSLNHWRPAGVAPAQLRISVCGELVAQFSVDQSMTQQIPLRGECEPRAVSFEVLNPFVASATDRRELGVQLVSAKIASRFGLPFFTPWFSLAVAGGIALLSLLVLAVLSPTPWAFTTLLIPVVAAYAISDSPNLLWNRVYALWLLSTALALAFALARGFDREKLSKPRGDAYFDSALAASAIFFIVLLGGALRFYGIAFGLPNNFHPDEVPKVNALMRMIEHGDLNPRYFLHPSLLLYSTYFLNNVFHYFGMEGQWRDTAFLAGRAVSAIAGTLSIYFIYLIGRRIYGRAVGLFSASLLAVFPLHVTCSRYMKEDALLLCLVLATTVLVLKAVYEQRSWLLFVAAFVAGCSASAKYSGMLSGAIVFGAPWLKTRSWLPDKRLLIITVAALTLMPLGFVACTPYSVIDSSKFIKDFQSEQHHMERGHTIPLDAWSQYWMYHVYSSILPGMSVFSAVLGIIGMGLLLWRRRFEDLMVVGLILLFYLPAEWVKAKPAPQPERYILPCLPFLAIALAEGLQILAAAMSRSALRRAIPALTACALLIPTMRSVNLASELMTDTRSEMAKWMTENLPRGSKVYLDWKPYAPRFWDNEFQITYVPRATILNNLNLSNLRKSDQDYLVLSSLFYDRYFSQPHGDASLRQRFREVFEQVPVVKQFSPQYGTYGFHNPMLTLFSLKREDFARLDNELALKRQGKIQATSNEMMASIRWEDRKNKKE